MKILKLPAYHDPEQTASSHLAHDLEDAYIAAGIVTEVYCPTPTRGISDDIRKKYKKIKLEETYEGKIIVHRFSMFREGKNPIQRALRYVLVNFKQYNKGSGAENIDVIMSGSTPPTQGMLCAKVKKKLSRRYKREVPMILALQDIFPDSLVTAKMTKKGSLIWKIGRKIEDYTYKNADKIIVISEDFKKNIMEKGVPEDKIVVVPNWVDSEKVYPIERKDNILFERYGLDKDKFYVTYSGNIGHSQNMRMLLDAAKQLRDTLPDLRFVLIGEGAAKEEVEKAIADEGVDTVIMLPFQPYEDIAHVFSLGDAGLIISKSGTGNNSVPSKTWSIMAAARPVLASFDEGSALSNLIAEVGCGVTAKADDIDELKAAIVKLYENRDNNSAMGALGRAYLKEYLDKDKCVGMYVETIKNSVK
ncbi:MAG: glycosyltransferase family 4 protein [Ruminococcaceae bacterium]|nr:glycosyltransferase family 4 protein [Oscillospiraceae bacterium]